MIFTTLYCLYLYWYLCVSLSLSLSSSFFSQVKSSVTGVMESLKKMNQLINQWMTRVPFKPFLTAKNIDLRYYLNNNHQHTNTKMETTHFPGEKKLWQSSIKSIAAEGNCRFTNLHFLQVVTWPNMFLMNTVHWQLNSIFFMSW